MTSAVWSIARKELREMWRDGRFRAAAVVVLALLAGALMLGWRHYSSQRAEQEFAQRATRQQWVGQGKKNPHSAAHYGVYAFKPKMPLSLVDRGVDAYTGQAVWLEAHKMNEARYRAAQDATAVQRFGELTGAMVLQLLIPLLIVLMSFGAFAGEREAGTLHQLMSLGVRPSALALGKAVGVSAALGMLLAPAALVGLVALAATGAWSVTAARLAGMAAGYLLYFMAFLALCLAVSAWCRTQGAALLILLAFWMANGLMAPRAASDIARALHPTPSSFAFTQSIQQAMAEPDNSRDQALIARLLRQYKVERPEDLPVNLAGIRLQDAEERGDAIYDAAYGRLWSAYALQDGVAATLSLAAPSLAMRSVSMAFAGTDFAQHAHFAQAAEAYRRRMQQMLNDDIARNAPREGAYLSGDALWARIPAFAYTAPDAGWVLRRQWPALAVLALWCAAAVALAAWRVRRMEAV